MNKETDISSSVAEWLRPSVSNFVGSSPVGSNPIADTINHKTTAYSILPKSVNEYSIAIREAQALVP